MFRRPPSCSALRALAFATVPRVFSVTLLPRALEEVRSYAKSKVDKALWPLRRSVDHFSLISLSNHLIEFSVLFLAAAITKTCNPGMICLDCQKHTGLV